MAKVSHRRVGFDSVFCFRDSLNLFSGCPMLRVPLATSEKKTIFGRCVSSIRNTCPTHLLPYQRPWSGAQRGCTGSDSARGIFLDLSYGEYHVDCPSVQFLKAQGLSDTKSSKRSCVIQLSMMSAMRFPEILNGEMPLWLSHDALSFLFLYRWMALVFLKSSGRYLIRNRCFLSLELLIFFWVSSSVGGSSRELRTGR